MLLGIGRFECEVVWREADFKATRICHKGRKVNKTQRQQSKIIYPIAVFNFPIYISQTHNLVSQPELLFIMANDIGGHLEVYMLTPVPEDQNPSGYQRFRLPVSSKQLDGYLKRLDPKAKILPDLTTLQHKAVNIIKQHLQDENLGLGVVKLVEQRVYSTNDDTKYTPVNVVYIVLRPISKDDESMRQHQIEAIPIENAADSQPALSTSYIQIAEIMPEEGIVEGLQAELDRQPVLTKQSIAPIVTHKKKQKGKKKGKPAETSSTSSYRGSFATVHGQKEDDDKNQAAHQTQEDTRIRESFAAAAEARTSCEDSTLTSSTATLSHQ